MLPGFAKSNGRYGGWRNTVQTCDFGAGVSIGAQSPDSQDIGFNELCGVYVLTLDAIGMIHSVARHLVLCMIALRALIQVDWIATGRIVALVQNVQAFGYGAVRQNIGYARSRLGSRFVVELPIAVWTTARLPFPTIIRPAHVYLFPEAKFYRANSAGGMFPSLHTMAVNKAHRLALNVARSYVCSLCDRRGLTPTAFAQLYLGKFQLELGWGMLRHGNCASSAVAHARGCFRSALALLLQVSIVAQMSAFPQQEAVG